MIQDNFHGVIKLAHSKYSIDDLLERLSATNKSNKNSIQLFDPSAVISRNHLIGAYADALMAFSEKRNVSSTVAVEMMLYAAMTRQIRDAIGIMGAKSSKGFVVFSDSRSAYSRLKDLLKNEKEFNPTMSESLRAAKRFGIDQEEDLDGFVMQKMALSLLD